MSSDACIEIDLNDDDTFEIPHTCPMGRDKAKQKGKCESSTSEANHFDIPQ